MRVRGWIMATMVGGVLVGNPVAGAQEKPDVAKLMASSEQLAALYRHVGEAVEPSVVRIDVRMHVKIPANGQAPENDFGSGRQYAMGTSGTGHRDAGVRVKRPGRPKALPRSIEGVEEALGSGVIVEADEKTGYVVTNAHVIEEAFEIKVTLSDKRVIRNARMLGRDTKTDLAILRIEAPKLKAAPWGDSSKLGKGEWVMAFGTPLGLAGSMTHGIVSATNRQIGINREMGYEQFLQIDVPINPGNSGGPLVNLRGEVVGINAAIASEAERCTGLGFAIPSNQAKAITAVLKEKGKVTRGWLGVSVSDVSLDPDVARTFGYTGETGALVEDTLAGTPAVGKLHAGDVITAFNGEAVRDYEEFRLAVAAIVPGSEVKVQAFRGGKTIEVVLHAAEQPEKTPPALKAKPGKRKLHDAGAVMGMRLLGVNAPMAQRRGLGNVHSGAVVLKVTQGSPADVARLAPKDVIVQVGERAVKTATEVIEAIGAGNAVQGIRLWVMGRGGGRFTILRKEGR